MHRPARPPDRGRQADAQHRKHHRDPGMSDVQSSDRRRAMLRTAMGPAIAGALADPAVIEIMVNPDGVLRLDRLGEGRIETGTRYDRSEEHTSELQSLIRISYAVFCLKKKKKRTQ